MEIQIDDDIPLPPIRRNGGRKPGGYSQALRMMKVHQSLVYRPPRGGKNSANRLAFLIAGETGHKFTCRTVEENGERLVRIWRTA